MVVGVLAFHGDFAEHLDVLRSLNADARDVRSLEDLQSVDRLIIPGGESTVMSRLLESTGVGAVITKRAKEGSLAIYGTCAGTILLAKTVTGQHPPETLKLMDITVERNAYGRQLQSFRADLTIKGIPHPVPVSFIRAPIIREIGNDVEVLEEHDGQPVLVRQGRMLAGTFHPEVRGETALHEMFLSM